MKTSALERWIFRPALQLLKQGVTPEKLALSIALGVVLGIFPVLGTTTLLCAVVGWCGGFNQPVIQSVNYFVYPLQLFLLIPFFRWGEIIFHVTKSEISLTQVRVLIHENVLHAIAALWITTWHAVVGWMVIAPVGVCVIYVILVPAFRSFPRPKTLHQNQL